MGATLVGSSGGATVVSGSAVVPEEARVALITVPRLFRLDVQYRADTVRITVRPVGDSAVHMRSPGYGQPVIATTELGELRPSRYDVTVVVDGPDGAAEIPVLVAATRDRANAVVTLTAQAVVDGV